MMSQIDGKANYTQIPRFPGVPTYEDLHGKEPKYAKKFGEFIQLFV